MHDPDPGSQPLHLGFGIRDLPGHRPAIRRPGQCDAEQRDETHGLHVSPFVLSSVGGHEAEKIGQLADVRDVDWTQSHVNVDMLIRLERTEPPAGMVVPPRNAPAGLEPLLFIGWLGLMRVLAEAMCATDPEAKGG